MEKQPESEEDPLEHRTDGTDAFDTLYIGCEKFPQYDLYPIAIGGVVTTQHPIENFSLIKHKLDFAYFHHHYKLFND